MKHPIGSDLHLAHSQAKSESQSSNDSGNSFGSSLLAPISRSTSSATSGGARSPRRWSGSGPKSPLLTPSGLLERLPASWTSSKRNNQSLLTWEADGYASLPDNPRIVLEDLGESISGLGSEPVPVLPDTGFPATRDIPRDTAFTLAFEGVLPDATTFELRQVAPALIQAGEYELSLSWLGENGEYQNIAASKSLEYRVGKKVLASSETNSLLWRSEVAGHPSTITCVKEKWWQRARSMRDQMYRWELRFVPLEETTQEWRHHSGGSCGSPRECFDAEAIFPTYRSTPPSSHLYTESPDYFSFGRPVITQAASAPVITTPFHQQERPIASRTSPLDRDFALKVQIHSPREPFFQAPLSPRRVAPSKA